MRLHADARDYIAAMNEAARKTREGGVLSAFRNSVRSFWVPEVSTDPRFLRLVRIDKTVTATIIAVPLLIIGLTAAVLVVASRS